MNKSQIELLRYFNFIFLQGCPYCCIHQLVIIGILFTSQGHCNILEEVADIVDDNYEELLADANAYNHKLLDKSNRYNLSMKNWLSTKSF